MGKLVQKLLVSDISNGYQYGEGEDDNRIPCILNSPLRSRTNRVCKLAEQEGQEQEGQEQEGQEQEEKTTNEVF